MSVLSDTVDSSSPEFARNAQAMRALVDDLRRRTAEAGAGGPEESRRRHAARGKLPPRERVERLVDPASPFLEIGALAANGMYEGDVHAASLICGVGRVEGRTVMIVCNDATVKGGTYYPITVK